MQISVLVVDDEPSILELVGEKLRQSGYAVLEASSGPEALAVSERHRNKIDILLTDLIMPGMTGRALADAVHSRGLDVPVIFMSGYIDELRSEALEEDVLFIQKPINWEKLGRMMHDSLKKKKRSA